MFPLLPKTESTCQETPLVQSAAIIVQSMAMSLLRSSVMSHSTPVSGRACCNLYLQRPLSYFSASQILFLMLKFQLKIIFSVSLSDSLQADLDEVYTCGTWIQVVIGGLTIFAFKFLSFFFLTWDTINLHLPLKYIHAHFLQEVFFLHISSLGI